MRPGMFVLMGFPGVGKLTVARTLAAQLEADGQTVRIVDNHWINNPIFGLVQQDGVTPLPVEVWHRVDEVSDAVLKTVERLTPESWHVIFTAYVDGVTAAGWFTRIVAVAAARNAALIPVRLLCEPDENARRIVTPERRAQMKSVDPQEPQRLAALGTPYDPGHPNT
ncbi:MAG: hypothetical protein ACR2QM_15285, partial [Longimicrobiales bacterium]